MRLIATYDMHYGPKGPMDAEGPLIKRGDEFFAEPNGKASADEVGRALIRNGVAMTPEAWAKRQKLSDLNYTWAADVCSKAREAHLNRKAGRGA